MCGTLGSFHRTLSTYLNELVANGLQIEKIVEPMLPRGDYESPDRQQLSIVPTELIVKTTAFVPST